MCYPDWSSEQPYVFLFAGEGMAFREVEPLGSFYPWVNFPQDDIPTIMLISQNVEAYREEEDEESLWHIGEQSEVGPIEWGVQT